MIYELTSMKNNQEKFFAACKKGNIKTVKCLLNKDDVDINQLSKDFYRPLQIACENGHLEVATLLSAQDGINLNYEFGCGNELFQVVCSNGHFEVAKLLLSLEGIVLNREKLFHYVCERGYTDLAKLFPSEAKRAINQAYSGTWTSFYRACQNGHAEIVKLLLSQEMWPATQDRIKQQLFHYACQNGHAEIVKLLLSQYGVAINKANYGVTPFFQACKQGHLDIVNLLLSQEGIAINQADVFEYRVTPLCIAYDKGHTDVVARLLVCADIVIDARSYDYLEAHQQEYGQHIDVETERYLAQLTATIEVFRNENPNGIFDFPLDEAGNLDIEQSLKGYYVLRHLIRCSEANEWSQLANHVDIQESIEQLLTIPSIKEWVIINATYCFIPHNATYCFMPHKSNRVGKSFTSQTNELLRLAQSVGHEAIVTRLLDISAIREAAEENNYYEGEAAYDLREVAQNQESSMRSLAPQEKESMAQIEAAYRETIKNQGGAPKVITSLKETLKERYLADEDSRTVTLNGESYLLPFEWSELQTFFKEHRVTPEQQPAILAIYYKNQNHTAYRYLSKPNCWMSDKASYVYISDDRQERWSTFEEHQTLIAYLWIAANDENQLPREANATVANRVDLFIRQVALLNRGHNWDKHRVMMDESGNSILDDFQSPIEEEYDDLEGDKPSCYSGVKTRLFQSLLYHSLYEILDKAVARQFINYAIHEYYASVLNDDSLEDLQGLQNLVGNCFVDLESPLPQEIEKLALTDMQQAIIKDTFIAHYGEEKAAAFLPVIDDLLNSDGLIANDFLRFYQSAHLDKLLETMQKTYIARQIINEVALTYVRKLAQPRAEAEFESVNQLLFAIKNQGIGCIWGEIKDVVKDQYNKAIQNEADAPAWENISDSVDNVLLNSATQLLIQTEIKADIKQSTGYQAYRNNQPDLNKQFLFWAKPESARWTLMGCVKAAVKEYQEKSKFSTKRKDEVKAQMKGWEVLSTPDLAEKLCAIFNTKKGGWSENSFKGLVAWHVYNHYEKFGLKTTQPAIFGNLPRKNKGIRHNCNWHGKQTIPLLCDALRAEFPAPVQNIRVNMI